MPYALKPAQQWARNKQLADYLGVTTMCLWRWKHDPALGCPKSFEINSTEYNNLHEWDAWLRARAIANANHAARPSRVERLRGKDRGAKMADRSARDKAGRP